MKLFGFVRSIFDDRYGCEYFISGIEDLYAKCKKQYPAESQHSLLAHAWFYYMVTKGANPNDESIKFAAIPTTQIIAQVPESIAPRMLGLFLLYRERPEVFEKYKYLLDEFNKIMLPLLSDIQKGEDLQK